jgi:putative phosphonoacetaldehyde dehydrogenase
MFLNGKLCGAPRLEVRSPWNDELAGTVAMDSAIDVDQAVRAVARYDRRLTGERRSAILADTAGRLRSRREALAALITAEAGLCFRDSTREVDRACANLRIAAEEARRIHGQTTELTAGQERRMALTIREPVGTVAAITPFNRPLNQVVVKVAPAIAANNAVVVKPSEKAPLAALELAQALVDSGLPPEMIAVVTGDPVVLGTALVTHELVDMVTFTGSVGTGERIAAAAGMRKLLLELGGNDPLIVLDDADLDRAVAIAVAGAFGNSGQSCRGVKRILVTPGVADEFADRLRARACTLRFGDPRDPATDVGPLISEQHAAAVAAACAAAVAQGARLLCGGHHEGAVVAPTVLDHVDPAAGLVTEETFGPVAPLITVGSADEAIEVANSTRYGLQAGVVTNSIDAFLSVASGLRVGAVNLMDGPQFDSPYVPFGGVKKSGLGREGIRFAIAEMTTIKTIVLPWLPAWPSGGSHVG